MRKSIKIFLSLLPFLSLNSCQKMLKNTIEMNPEILKAPIAKKIPHQTILHNDTIIDNYFWLRDRENKEVIEHLNAENTYKEAVMAPTKPLQDQLFNEMKGRIKEDDESVPYKDGHYFYYTKFEKGGEYPIFCRKKGSLNGQEEIMLDGNILGKGKPYFNIGGLETTDNEEILAFAIDTVMK